MYIIDIKLVLLSGLELNVTQLALPLFSNEYSNLNKVILKCSDNSEVVFEYKKDYNSSISDDYAYCWHEKHKDLFGHAFNNIYYYFVAYSSFQMNILSLFNTSERYHSIDLETQDGYLRWTSLDNFLNSSKKLVAERVDNGVIVPLQHDADENIYNFDYLNIVEVMKKCIIDKKSAYVRVSRYDPYISSEFNFKGALIVKDIPEKKYLKITIVSYDNSEFEIFNKFILKDGYYNEFKTRLLKSKVLGIR